MAQVTHVQRGAEVLDRSDVSVTITLTSTVITSSTALFWGAVGRGSSPSKALWGARLEDGDTLVFTRTQGNGVGLSGGTINWQIVEFASDTNVQHLSISGVGYPFNQTLPEAIEPTRTFLVMNRDTGAGGLYNDNDLYAAHVTASTTLEWHCSAATSDGTRTHRVQTVHFPAGDTVQRNNYSYSAAEATVTISLASSIDLTQAWAQFAAVGAGFRQPRHSWYVELPSEDTIRFTRIATGDDGILYYEVIESAGASVQAYTTSLDSGVLSLAVSLTSAVDMTKTVTVVGQNTANGLVGGTEAGDDNSVEKRNAFVTLLTSGSVNVEREAAAIYSTISTTLGWFVIEFASATAAQDGDGGRLPSWPRAAGGFAYGLPSR
jgi:hypothetical protein